MTTYTIEVNSTPVTFTSLRFSLGGGAEPDTWEAILSSASTSITLGHSVDIKRDGTTTFSGIVEVTEPQFGNSTSKKISGRHNKVKLWRKWNERYSEEGGFWTSYYPNKIVSFLMRPSFSTYDEDDFLTKIGWGLSPAAWTITSVKAAGGSNDLDGSHSSSNLKSRLNTNGWRSDSNQTQNDYIQVDLGSSISIIGIRIVNKLIYTPTDGNGPQEYIRNYKIEGSVTGAWGGEEITLTATVSDNRALSIVESWAAQSVRYIRIYCTTSFADKWSASDIYVYENDAAITGISEGTLTEHLPLNCSLMTANASSGQANITVQEGWRFKEREVSTDATSGDRIIIADDNGEEYGLVQSVSGNILTLEANLSNNYTTAANGLVLNYSREFEFNIEYSRRSDSINKVVKTCTDTSNNPWVWGLSNAGAVSMGSQIGSDVSGSVSFVQGSTLFTGASRTDARKTVDRVMVVGRGKEDTQDRTASGWQGSGDYEHIAVDNKLESQEATKSKGQEILQLNDSGVQTETVLVDDSGHATNAWGVDDDITLTSAILGLSGSYRVKSVSRRYDSNGEKVTIQTTRRRSTSASIMANIIKQQMESQLVTGDRPTEVLSTITENPVLSLYYDATSLTLDDSVTIEADIDSTNNKHIKMAQAESGVVLSGPGATVSSGKYEARFYLKVTSNASSSNLFNIDVYSTSLGSTFNTRTIAPDDFTTSNTWQVFSVFFEATTDYFDVEFRINTFQTGITDLYCDWIGIVPTISAPGAIDASILEIELRPWNSNLSVIWDDVDDVPPTDYNHVLWGAPSGEGSGGTDATITFDGGDTQTITANADTNVGNGVWWIYWTDDNSVLQWTQTYSAAVGEGKGLIGIVEIDNATPEAPSIILFNAYTPTIGAGIIAAYSIFSKHISADWITGKNFQTATNVGTGVAGIRINSTGIYGYDDSNPGTIQFQIEAATGKGLFGGGNSFIDATGITLKTTDGTIGINLLSGVTVRGGIYSTDSEATNRMYVTTLNSADLVLASDSILYLLANNTIIAGDDLDLVSFDLILNNTSGNIRSRTGNLKIHWYDTARAWYFDGVNSGAAAGVAGPNLHIRGDDTDSVPSVQFLTGPALGDTLEMSIFSDGLTNVISGWQPSTALALHVYGDAGAPDTALRLDFEAPAAASGIDYGDTSFANSGWWRIYSDTKTTQKFAINGRDGNVYVHNNIQPNAADSYAVGTSGTPFLSMATNYLTTLYIQPKSGSTAIIIQDDGSNSRFTFTDLESGSTDWAFVPIANGAGHVGTSGAAFKSVNTNYMASLYLQPLSGNSAIIIQDDGANARFEFFDLESGVTNYAFRPTTDITGILGGSSNAFKKGYIGVIASGSVAFTLGVGVTTFAVGSFDVSEVTGDGGLNNVSTITAGSDGQRITLIFRDNNVTMIDTAAPAAGTLSLSGAANWRPNAQDTLTLVFDNTSWYETSRSVN